MTGGRNGPATSLKRLLRLAAVRHGRHDLRLVIRRTTLYLGLSTGLALLYTGAAGLGYQLLGALLPLRPSPSLPGFVAALSVALAFRPLHDTLRDRIDRLFLGKRADALHLLTEFGRAAVPDEAALERQLLTLVEDALAPAWIRLECDGRAAAVMGEPPPRAQAGADAVALSLPGVGTLTLGPRRNERPYDAEERQVLALLARQAASAFMNARLFEERLRLRAQEGIASRLATEREQLLMQVVHDLRSDLSTIAIASHLARKAPREPGPYATVRESIERIRRLLDDKTDRIDGGRPEARTPLRRALDGAIAALLPQLAQKGQHLELALPGEDLVLPLSEVEVEQIILNLVGNAHKFAPEGTTVRLVARRDGDALCLAVEDEGPGIRPELLAMPGSGRRGDERVPGSGLGLRNVRAIAESVGGTLEWRNTARGASVAVRLPVEGA